jgi:hypothetical protein
MDEIIVDLQTEQNVTTSDVSSVETEAVVEDIVSDHESPTQVEAAVVVITPSLTTLVVSSTDTANISQPGHRSTLEELEEELFGPPVVKKSTQHTDGEGVESFCTAVTVGSDMRAEFSQPPSEPPSQPVSSALNTLMVAPKVALSSSVDFATYSDQLNSFSNICNDHEVFTKVWSWIHQPYQPINSNALFDFFWEDKSIGGPRKTVVYLAEIFEWTSLTNQDVGMFDMSVPTRGSSKYWIRIERYDSTTFVISVKMSPKPFHLGNSSVQMLIYSHRADLPPLRQVLHRNTIECKESVLKQYVKKNKLKIVMKVHDCR